MVTKINPAMIDQLDALINSRIAAISGGKIDVGDYVISPASSKPSFLKCDGAAVSRTTYSVLFGKIGVTFGAGNGTTTFNIPNAVDVFPLLAGTRAIGLSGGAATHTLTEQEMPTHNHSGSTASAGAHTHTGGTGSMNSAEGGSGGSPFQFPQGGPTGSSGAHTHTLTINNTGGGQAHNNMPPYLVIGNLFIYAGV